MVYIALAVVLAFVSGAGLMLFLQRQRFVLLPDRGHRDFNVPDEKALEDLSRILGKFGPKPTWRIDDGKPGGIHRVVFGDKKTTLAVIPEHLLKIAGNPAANISYVVKDPAAEAKQLVSELRKAGYKATDHGQLGDEINDGAMRVISTTAANVTAGSGWVIVLRKWGPKMGQKPVRYKRSGNNG